MSHSERKLRLLEVFCIASGAMISSGLFVLPSVVYGKAGPSILLSYLFAGIMMIPALLSQAELATAMPKAGGSYFFIGRSLGPLMGNFAGFANWFSISLKGSFALIGIGAFLQLIFPEVSLFQIKLVALGFIVVFTVLNLISTESSGHVQDLLVFLLIGILLFYIFSGATKVQSSNFTPFFKGSWHSVLYVSGMVFISYGGLTKVASLAGEVKNPGKTLPTGMMLSFIVVNTLYLAAISITIGLLGEGQLTSSLTPLSTAAGVITGRFGVILLALGAVFSFATTANASILSASQQPLAMAEDGLLPSFFKKRSQKRGIPVPAILFTSGFMAVVILGLNLENLVKAASTMMLILFFFVNLAVILMRESRIVSYRPKYKSPLYPVVQIAGMIFSVLLITEMGKLPIILSAAFFIFSTILFLLYRRGKSHHDSALVRIVERVAAREIRDSALHDELTEILLDRDNVNEDRFDHLIRKAIILDIKKDITKEALFEKIASGFSLKFENSPKEILDKLWERENESTTAVSSKLAIPHVVLEGDHDFEILVVRVRDGVYFSENEPEIKIIFSLAGTTKERNFHLKALMAIAQIVQSSDFDKQWDMAQDEEELRNLILLTERFRK